MRNTMQDQDSFKGAEKPADNKRHHPIESPPSPPNPDPSPVGSPYPGHERGIAHEIYGDEPGGQEPTRPRKRPIDPD